jgi:hypothetical protein
VRQGWAVPRPLSRGSFDRIVCTEPLVFAADAVIYLCIFNSVGSPIVVIVSTEVNQRSRESPLSGQSWVLQDMSECRLQGACAACGHRTALHVRAWHRATGVERP